MGFSIERRFCCSTTAPPFHPWCRSCTCPYFDDEFSQDGYRASRTAEGKTVYEVPADMTYPEWEEKFVDVDKSGGSGIMNTGATSGALNSDSDEAIAHAEMYYKSVRKMKTDVDNIVSHTGLPKEMVSKAKNHLFMQKHDLGNDMPDYFYPDYDIAQSWQRLSTKNAIVENHDIVLIRHENMEAKLMAEGLTQQQAHDEANKHYNYQKALDERLK